MSEVPQADDIETGEAAITLNLSGASLRVSGKDLTTMGGEVLRLAMAVLEGRSLTEELQDHGGEKPEGHEDTHEVIPKQFSLQELDVVLVPPIEGKVIKRGHNKVGIDEGLSKSFPRKSLLRDLLIDMGVDVEKCTEIRGKVEKGQLRKTSYSMILIPALGKMILVCDEAHNATFMIHGHGGNAENFYKMNKDQLKAHPEVERVLWTENLALWSARLKAALTRQSVRKPIRKESTAPTGKRYVMSKDGVVTLEAQDGGIDAIAIRTYCATIKKTHSSLAKIIDEAGIDPIPQVVGINGSRIVHLYPKEEVDGVVDRVAPVATHTVGTDRVIDIDGELLVGNAYLVNTGKRRATLKDKLRKGGSEPIHLFCPELMIQLADALYSEPLNPEYTPYRKVLSLLEIKNRLDLLNYGVTKFIRSEFPAFGGAAEFVEAVMKIKARAAIVQSGSTYNKKVWSKKDMDAVVAEITDADLTLDRSPTGGVLSITHDGICLELVFIGAYANACGLDAGSLKKRMEAGCVKPFGGLTVRIRGELEDVYRKADVDKHVYKKITNGQITVEHDETALELVNLHGYAIALGLSTHVFIRLCNAQLEPVQIPGKKFKSGPRYVKVYRKSDVDSLIDRHWAELRPQKKKA